MPTYNLKCNTCNEDYILSCSVYEFQELNKVKYLTLSCKKCGSSNFYRVYKNFSSKISRSSYEIVERVREEARSIVDKVRNGDEHAIRDVYGEGE